MPPLYRLSIASFPFSVPASIASSPRHHLYRLSSSRVKGHFGPINSIAFHPDGKSFSTGGEDGYVRIQSFDPNYFDFELDF